MSGKSSYTEEIADKICEQLAIGKSLTDICKDEQMPDYSTVFRWLEANESFRDKYARARELQADYFAAEIVTIADEQCEVLREDGTAFDPDVQRDRLRVDARKWYTSKVAPKKYGDKVTLAGDETNPFHLFISGLQKSTLPIAGGDDKS